MAEKKEELVANIGQFVMGDRSNLLMCLGLGSCVGVALYQDEHHFAGLMHVMLPFSPKDQVADSNIFKYADVGIPLLVDELLRKGCDRNNLKAKIAGGAHMFKDTLSGDLMDIGKRNVEAVKEVLKKEGVSIIKEEIGGAIGRTMKLNVENGEVLIRTKEGSKII